jgi:hypothetical protein
MVVDTFLLAVACACIVVAVVCAVVMHKRKQQSVYLKFTNDSGSKFSTSAVEVADPQCTWVAE